MKLSNEFTVAAPVERTWSALLDVPRVARALPGARIEPEGTGDGSWRGSMKVKLGPVTTEYAGTAQLQDADEDERVASFRVQGSEARGQGTASALIVSRLSEQGTGTLVTVETSLEVTGRQAQLGRGLLQDVAASVLDEFARRLESDLAGAPRVGPAAAGDAEALDIGAVAAGAVAERAALVVAGIAVGLLAGRLLWGRR